jgi:2-polyprenyl-6-hydroxyphenyl methylase/3-demethylubiquinone-9 3-methyltransferase
MNSTVVQPEARDTDRFAFGENWARFLRNIDEKAIAQACASLTLMTGLSDLKGRTFLDIGSGSGLFSLAAHRMGAQVTSFDYDPDSVGCTETLRARFGAAAPAWEIMRGSVLDDVFMARLGTYDLVYSWGVLHHTGAMWRAVDLAARAVKPDGCLFIALYNDQGAASRRWLRIKTLYNRLPRALRGLFVTAIVLPRELKWLILYLLKLNPMGYVRTWTDYSTQSRRGMNKWRDWVDWVGGLPFEVAKPEAVLDALRLQGFELERMTTCLGGWGCNEFVFQRVKDRRVSAGASE